MKGRWELDTRKCGEIWRAEGIWKALVAWGGRKSSSGRRVEGAETVGVDRI